MSDAYGQLLDATIRHLEDLKSRGVRNVVVSGETLRALARPRAETIQIPTVKSQIEKPAAPVAADKQAALPVETQSAIASPQSPVEKAAAFAALRERALACVKCPHLASSRKSDDGGVMTR